jgi:hypothetical protein
MQPRPLRGEVPMSPAIVARISPISRKCSHRQFYGKPDNASNTHRGLWAAGYEIPW